MSDNFLDSAIAIRRQDPSNVIGRLMETPDECRDADAIGERFERPEGWLASDAWRAVIIVGFGASAIAGEAIAACAASDARVPIIVQRSALMPAFVGDDTLVLAVSYGGETDETLRAFVNANAAGAHVVAITSGGALLLRSPIETTVCISPSLPTELSVAPLFFAMHALLRKLGILTSRDPIDEALGLLARQSVALGIDVASARNPAKQLASALLGRLPVIYVGDPLFAPVAARWRAQVNAAVKGHALTNSYPEVTHSEMLAWRGAFRQSDNWAVVVVRDPNETPAEAARINAASDVVPAEFPLHMLTVDGRSYAAKICTGMYFADFVCAYLATAWGEDPSAG